MARTAQTVGEITLLVRTPGDTQGYRSFTDGELSEAQSYARQRGVEVEVLP